jgi:hypothetical protein
MEILFGLFFCQPPEFTGSAGGHMDSVGDAVSQVMPFHSTQV